MVRKMIVVLILLSSIAAPAAAQAANNTTATSITTPTPEATAAEDTPTSTATATPEPNPPEDNSTTVVEIGPNTRVTSWTYRGGAFHVVIEADIPMRLTISEAVNQDGSGAGTITYQRRNLAAGTNEFRVPAETHNGEATIVLSTPASEANDRAAFLHHDGNGASLLSGPFDGSDVRDGAIGGASGVGFAVLYVVARAKLGADQRGERLA